MPQQGAPQEGNSHRTYRAIYAPNAVSEVGLIHRQRLVNDSWLFDCAAAIGQLEIVLGSLLTKERCLISLWLAKRAAV
jgi:hypothetical protein